MHKSHLLSHPLRPAAFRLYLLACLAIAVTAADKPAKIDNEQARILVVTSAPGVKSSLHEHRMNRVMIYLDSGTMLLASTNGNVETLHFKAGEAMWSPIAGLHTSLNVSGHPVRIVEVELKTKPVRPSDILNRTALDTIKVDPRRYHLERENDQVRIVRARYGPHEKGVMHEHVLKRAVIFLTDGNLKVTTPDGTSKIVKTAAGEVTWGGPAKHIEENLSDQPFEVLVVEFKE